MDTQLIKLLRVIFGIFSAAIILLFGFIPFVAGTAVQLICPRDLPRSVVGLLALATFLLLTQFFVYQPLNVNGIGSAWGSLVLSLFMDVPFFSLGAAFIRKLRRRRFGKVE